MKILSATDIKGVSIQSIDNNSTHSQNISKEEFSMARDTEYCSFTTISGLEQNKEDLSLSSLGVFFQRIYRIINNKPRDLAYDNISSKIRDASGNYFGEVTSFPIDIEEFLQDANGTIRDNFLSLLSVSTAEWKNFLKTGDTSAFQGISNEVKSKLADILKTEKTNVIEEKIKSVVNKAVPNGTLEDSKLNDVTNVFLNNEGKLSGITDDQLINLIKNGDSSAFNGKILGKDLVTLKNALQKRFISGTVENKNYSDLLKINGGKIIDNVSDSQIVQQLKSFDSLKATVRQMLINRGKGGKDIEAALKDKTIAQLTKYKETAGNVGKYTDEAEQAFLDLIESAV